MDLADYHLNQKDISLLPLSQCQADQRKDISASESVYQNKEEFLMSIGWKLKEI